MQGLEVFIILDEHGRISDSFTIELETALLTIHISQFKERSGLSLLQGRHTGCLSFCQAGTTVIIGTRQERKLA